MDVESLPPGSSGIGDMEVEGLPSGGMDMESTPSGGMDVERPPPGGVDVESRPPGGVDVESPPSGRSGTGGLEVGLGFPPSDSCGVDVPPSAL